MKIFDAYQNAKLGIRFKSYIEAEGVSMSRRERIYNRFGIYISRICSVGYDKVLLNATYEHGVTAILRNIFSKKWKNNIGYPVIPDYFSVWMKIGKSMGMKFRFFTLNFAYAAVAAIHAADGNTLPEQYTMVYGDTVRTYRIYLPSSVVDDAPLIVYTHGYGSKTRWRDDLNAVADSCGFAVCYPDGLPDSHGYDSWNVGYPSQKSMAIDEADFFRHLLDEVTTRFSLSRINVFMAGWSNGGDLCYQFAYTEPSLFRAYCSVGGLTFEDIYNENALTIPVPFLEIHGNADEFSKWHGDHLNTGGWGSYIPVPLAVAAVAANNRCTTITTETIPSKSDASRLVKLTSYGGSISGCDVILYEIEGGKHSWADTDVDTSKILCNFFSHYIVNEVKTEIRGK